LRLNVEPLTANANPVMIEIYADESTLERSAIGGITGLIFLRGPNGAFPDEQWTDFSVVILGWWIEGLRLLPIIRDIRFRECSWMVPILFEYGAKMEGLVRLRGGGTEWRQQSELSTYWIFFDQQLQQVSSYLKFAA
jgi:hypothetical protein